MFGSFQISEFNYRKSSSSIAHVLVGIRTNTDASYEALKKRLMKKKYTFDDLTKNEISNDHLRHMVGGRINHSLDPNTKERIFRTEFPERPRALLSFLESFGDKWNISLFHYRNLGSAFGKVLIGIEDGEKNPSKLIKQLGKTEVSFSEETRNKAYKSYLR